MKYIRTKDRIYEVEEWFKPLENDMVYIPDEGLNKILNQANTIEELCDWFVLRKDGKIYQMYAKEEYAVADLGQYSLAFEWVYAIETDKGLIYIARMNDKGELELL